MKKPAHREPQRFRSEMPIYDHDVAVWRCERTTAQGVGGYLIGDAEVIPYDSEYVSEMLDALLSLDMERDGKAAARSFVEKYGAVWSPARATDGFPFELRAPVYVRVLVDPTMDGLNHLTGIEHEKPEIELSESVSKLEGRKFVSDSEVVAAIKNCRTVISRIRKAKTVVLRDGAQPESLFPADSSPGAVNLEYACLYLNSALSRYARTIVPVFGGDMDTPVPPLISLLFECAKEALDVEPLKPCVECGRLFQYQKKLLPRNQGLQTKRHERGVKYCTDVCHDRHNNKKRRARRASLREAAKSEEKGE